MGVWAFLIPSVTVRPLNPVKDLQLGKPLPHQLPNPTKASFKEIKFFYLSFFFILVFKICSFALLTRTLLNYVLL